MCLAVWLIGFKALIHYLEVQSSIVQFASHIRVQANYLSSISVKFRGLICGKVRNVCFPTPGTAPKTHTFVVSF